MDVGDGAGGLTAAGVIRMLGLVPLLPEGGYVGETWRSEGSSAIYYLVERPDFSGLHRLAHVEVWAWHAGAPLAMLLVSPDGEVSEPVLGPGLEAGERPQVVVRPGWWQAAEPLGDWSLVSTFMAPPYADDVITFADGEQLATAHAAQPDHADRIRRLSRR